MDAICLWRATPRDVIEGLGFPSVKLPPPLTCWLLQLQCYQRVPSGCPLSNTHTPEEAMALLTQREGMSAFPLLSVWV